MTLKALREIKPVVDRVEDVLQDAYRANEAFNAALDEGEPLTVVGLGRDALDNSYQYTASEVLFWADRQAYLQELEDWGGRQIVESHDVALAFVRHSDQIPVLLDLADAIRLRRITPFVGAGFSIPCGYPLWSQTLWKLAERLKDVLISDIRPLMTDYEYLKVAQILRTSAAAQVDNFIKTEFRQRTDKLAGPVLLLPQLSSGCVVTTNFDSVIEDLFARSERPLDGYMHGRQPGNNFVQRLLRGERCILKLHGDARQENTYVFTDDQYRESYGEPLSFQNPLPRALRQIFIGSSLLFLGCSLEQDRTLDLFQQVVDEAAFEIPDHFALLNEPEDGRLKAAKEARLLGMKIRPLWYPAPDHDHSLLEQILRMAIAVSRSEVSI